MRCPVSFKKDYRDHLIRSWNSWPRLISVERRASRSQDESLLVATVVWDTETDAQEFFASFTFSTELRTGAQWETAGDGDTGSVMSLTGQTIFAELEADTTVLIFAPDSPTLQKVRAALDKAASPES